MRRLLLLVIVFLCLTISRILAQPPNTSTDEEKLWEDSGFENVNISMLSTWVYHSNPPNYTHAMDITIVNLRGAGWSKKK